MTHRPADGSTTTDATDLALRALVDEEERHAAAARRRRTWLLEQQAVESVTLVDLLGAAGASAAPVEVALPDGRLVRGHVRAVGHDVARIDGHEAVHLVRLAAITSIRPTERDLAILTPTVPLPSLPPFDEALRAEAADRCEVVLWSASARPVHGRLRGVGVDVVLVEPPSAAGEATTTAVALTAIQVVDLVVERGHSSSAPPLSAAPTTSG